MTRIFPPPHPQRSRETMRLVATALAVLSAMILVLARPLPAQAEEKVFEGRIEARDRAELSSRLDGVVIDLLFSGGEAVTKGQPLILLDPADAELALAVAEANLSMAEAELDGAAREARRQEQLAARGISPDAVVGPARTAKAAAEARVRLAKAERNRAALDLERTVVRAPIGGFVSEPLTVTGAFLEAESGAPLGRIIALDPVVVSYRVPYATRLATLNLDDEGSLEALLARIRITVTLPDGTIYPLVAVPDHTAAEVDPEDGTVTVRAPLANPDFVLRPGMAVTVKSTFAPMETQ